MARRELARVKPLGTRVGFSYNDRRRRYGNGGKVK